jgi:hypothetical protein
MALYLGVSNDGAFVTSDGYTLQDLNNLSLMAFPESNKFKIILNNVVYRLNVNLNTKESE